MQNQDIVASFRAELLQAISQIKALKEDNSSLKEQVEQLQEQVKVGEVLLQKEKKKRRRRFRAYIYIREDLTVCQAKCETLEASLHQEPAQPETSRSREVEVVQENQALKEEVDLLKTGQRILEDELKKKDKLLQTTPYLNCPATLTVKEKEVNKSQLKMQAAKLRKETTLTEGVSSREVEAIEKENKTLKKQVDNLKGEQKNLQEEVKCKEELVKKEIRKRQASTRSYLDCLHKLSDLENKLENVERSYGQKVRAA
ncbi:unnamed protein product [Pleuronectes platessa]|uniref:Uncharacterized protein n=1 Tax=Pleuronectes platessa TaxID=8262 RepID=A0A9N7Z131_PLEPL|nr:unnamed protein product [Pleuronectes platessa]